MAWVGLVWLRTLDYPTIPRKTDQRSLRLRRFVGHFISFVGFCLAIYGAW
jgi:hypothetical protein